MQQQLSISPQREVSSAAITTHVLNNEQLNIKDSSPHISVQCKLSVGAVDDPLEKEADEMADTVMRMPEQNFIQRKCAHCEEEEKLQRKPLASFIQKKCAHCQEEEGAQRKPLASFIQKKQSSYNNTVEANDNVSNQIQYTKGSGSQIPTATKSFMESRFGANFSNVNIHTGSYASQLSKELNAQAFTVGHDIYFNEGKYQPESNEGKHLLAHELTHIIQQNGSSNNVSRYPCPTSSCHVHEESYKRLHPLPPDPIIPDPGPFPFPYPIPDPTPTPVPVPPTPVPAPPTPPVPVTPPVDEDKIVEEIRNKLFKKVVTARDQDITYLPSRVPYPYRQESLWLLNIIVGFQAEGSIILSIKRYKAEGDTYVEYLFQEMRKKIEAIQTSRKKDDKDKLHDKDKQGDGDEDRQSDTDKKEKTDENEKEKEDCGRFDIVCKARKIKHGIEDIVDTAEKIDEFFGITDLLDLPDKIRALPEFIDLYEQMKLFWRFKDHIGEFETWLKEPQTLIRALIGLEPSPLMDDLQDWVEAGSDELAPPDKGQEIHSLAQRAKRVMEKVRALLKPVFAIRKNVLSLVSEIQNIVSQVPALQSIQYLISIAQNPDKLKEAGKEFIEDTVTEFAEDVTYLIRSNIEQVVQKLKLPVLKFSGSDFIDNGEIARAITKVATRLVPGIAGKLARTEPGKYVISQLVELLLNGIEGEVFNVINDKLGGFNKLLIKQFDDVFSAFESKMVGFIVPKINEKIFSKDVKVPRSAVDDQEIKNSIYLQMLPSVLQESKGEQINTPMLKKMESYIYPNFNDVRIHQDTTAEHAANMLHANAFTIGSDIYFGKGRYTPDADSGQKLLAHELTHVAQQKQGSGTGLVQRSAFDKFGEGIIDAISILPFVPLPETGLKNPKTQKPLRQKDRRFLRRNMQDPPWADPSIQHRGWNAHHIIPWEFLHHSVFDVLRANGGWDFNDPKNGIALPTRAGIPGAENLPVHQSRRILLRGHPVYSGKVKQRLDALLSLENEPARLRQEVYKLIDYLKANELVASKMPVLY